MQYGVTLPYLDPQVVADLAVEAENAGWDGIFVWDAIWGLDCWVVLTAAAARTQRIKLGPMLVPPSRKRPWEVASTAMTLDRFSNGRVIFSAGLGAPDTGWAKVGEETDKKVRAARMDEALDVIRGFWSGKPFSYKGDYFQVDDVKCEPTPTQQPIPIWVVGAWPYPKTLRRVAQYQGCICAFKDYFTRPIDDFGEDLKGIVKFVKADREKLGKSATPFDFVIEGNTPGDDAKRTREILTPYIETGLTWWLENVWKLETVEAMRERIKQGPPKV